MASLFYDERFPEQAGATVPGRPGGLARTGALGSRAADTDPDEHPAGPGGGRRGDHAGQRRGARGAGQAHLCDRAAWWLPAWLDRLLHALEAPTELDVRVPVGSTVADVVTPPEPADDRRASIVS
jgi:hypothetical protein